MRAMSNENLHNITIEVETSYIEGQSEPEKERYVFSYTITIRNEGDVPAQLISRHWIITDANGHTQEVHGEGVVGEQPHLNPGEGFQYTSGTMIGTPVGSMRGAYQMVAENGVEFDAIIPPFTLAIPRTLH
jgi:ApaG protein